MLRLSVSILFRGFEKSRNNRSIYLIYYIQEINDFCQDECKRQNKAGCCLRLCVYRETGVFIEKFDKEAFKALFANEIGDDNEFIITNEWKEMVNDVTDRCVARSIIRMNQDYVLLNLVFF